MIKNPCQGSKAPALCSTLHESIRPSAKYCTTYVTQIGRPTYLRFSELPVQSLHLFLVSATLVFATCSSGRCHGLLMRVLGCATRVELWARSILKFRRLHETEIEFISLLYLWKGEGVYGYLNPPTNCSCIGTSIGGGEMKDPGTGTVRTNNTHSDYVLVSCLFITGVARKTNRFSIVSVASCGQTAEELLE